MEPQQSGAKLVLSRCGLYLIQVLTQEDLHILEVPDLWCLAQLLPIAGAQCRLETDHQRRLRSERGGILSNVMQLATIGGE